MNREMLRSISDDEIKTFQHDGVVCVRGVVDEEWITRLREALEGIPGGYADRIFMWTFNDTFKELAFDSPLGELCATFMSSQSCGLLAERGIQLAPHMSICSSDPFCENARLRTRLPSSMGPISRLVPR